MWAWTTAKRASHRISTRQRGDTEIIKILIGPTKRARTTETTRVVASQVNERKIRNKQYSKQRGKERKNKQRIQQKKTVWTDASCVRSRIRCRHSVRLDACCASVVQIHSFSNFVLSYFLTACDVIRAVSLWQLFVHNFFVCFFISIFRRVWRRHFFARVNIPLFVSSDNGRQAKCQPLVSLHSTIIRKRCATVEHYYRVACTWLWPIQKVCAAFSSKSRAMRTPVGAKAVAKISEHTPARRPIWMSERISPAARMVNNTSVTVDTNWAQCVFDFVCATSNSACDRIDSNVYFDLPHSWYRRSARIVHLHVPMSIATQFADIDGR